MVKAYLCDLALICLYSLLLVIYETFYLQEKNGGGDVLDEAITDSASNISGSGDAAGGQKFARRWQVYISNLTWVCE